MCNVAYCRLLCRIKCSVNKKAIKLCLKSISVSRYDIIVGKAAYLISIWNNVSIDRLILCNVCLKILRKWKFVCHREFASTFEIAFRNRKVVE